NCFRRNNQGAPPRPPNFNNANPNNFNANQARTSRNNNNNFQQNRPTVIPPNPNYRNNNNQNDNRRINKLNVRRRPEKCKNSVPQQFANRTSYKRRRSVRLNIILEIPDKLY